MIINTIKNFVVQKKNKTKDNQPDRRVVAKVGEEWVEVAVGWVKKNEKGDQYLTCQMTKTWVDHTDRTKSRDGFVIVSERELSELMKLAGQIEGEDELPTNNDF